MTVAEPFAFDALAVPGGPGAWSALGFEVVADRMTFANGAVRVGAPRVELEVAGPQPGGEALVADGVTVNLVVPPTTADVDHSNGASELDHLVVMTDSIERTSAAIADTLGLEQRRVRETPQVRQAFHRFPDVGDTRGCIIEVVERPDLDAVSIWGVVMIVDDLDRLVAEADGLVGEPRDAVQPGRRIATVRREAGLPLAVALMSG